MSRPLLAAALAASLLASSACGDEFERPSQLQTLRVLAVSADAPYSPPGGSPRLSMALVDAAPGAVQGGVARKVSVVWLGGCDNPPDDAHGACVPALHRAVAQLTDDDLAAERLPDNLPAGQVGYGTSFDARLPDDIIATHPPVDGAAFAYGFSQVFFAACGGQLRRDPAADPTRDFPLMCVDSAGQRLGATDFVTGYASLWAYQELRNQNPLLVSSQLLASPSSGQACGPDVACPAGESCGTSGQCLLVVPACPDDGADTCPSIAVQPRVERSSVERAVSASVAAEQAPPENLWVAYFSQRGRLDADARFIHDGDVGWIDDHATSWRAPRTPGEARLWAVVRDNRGGVSWVFQDVLVADR